MSDDGRKLGLREAAEMFDVSRPTLTKALKAGKLSGERDGAGAWRVDPSELARVYRPRKGPISTTRLEPGASTELAELRAALDVERARREAAETLAEERAERIADLRRLLPPPDATPAPGRRRWWPFGR